MDHIMGALGQADNRGVGSTRGTFRFRDRQTIIDAGALIMLACRWVRGPTGVEGAELIEGPLDGIALPIDTASKARVLPPGCPASSELLVP
jgi:hypothetical protein